ncbi:MAG: tRNA 2-selenouridine(34) synthase MnmH [Georgfuchsia sp.]
MKAPDHTLATVAQLAEFDAVIDVRSPAEYAEDHIPGAISCPVLDNEERIRVGTLYKQESPFAARKVGAALVARNIARHIEEQFSQHPKSWRPLVYCWRGGQRSGAFSHVLREIGWSARRLEGGYKSWRHHVLENLASLPAALRFCVISGPTGSGKSRLLEAMARQGAQVLHLEKLAAHKGSVLGDLPDAPQPSQKKFETGIHQALVAFDASRPVFIEAESRRIGQLTLPPSIFDAIGKGRRLRIEASVPARVDFLLSDYAYLCDAERLHDLLDRLMEMQGREVIARWQGLAGAGDFRTLVTELLTCHYDRLYERSLHRQFPNLAAVPVFPAHDLSPAGIEILATEIIARS